jgi:hypothetical protein
MQLPAHRHVLVSGSARRPGLCPTCASPCLASHAPPEPAHHRNGRLGQDLTTCGLTSPMTSGLTKGNRELRCLPQADGMGLSGSPCLRISNVITGNALAMLAMRGERHRPPRNTLWALPGCAGQSSDPNNNDSAPAETGPGPDSGRNPDMCISNIQLSSAIIPLSISKATRQPIESMPHQELHELHPMPGPRNR